MLSKIHVVHFQQQPTSAVQQGLSFSVEFAWLNQNASSLGAV